MDSDSPMSHFHLPHRLPAQFSRVLAANLVPLLVLECPCTLQRIESDPDDLPGPRHAHAVRPVLHRYLALDIHSTRHPIHPHQVPDLLEIPTRLLLDRVVGPSRVLQARVGLPAGSAARDGIALALNTVHDLQPLLQLDTRFAGPGLAPSLADPCDRSTTPLSCGLRGGLAVTSTSSPASQQTRSVGRSPRDPQGAPLSTRSRWGRPHLWNECLRAVRVSRGSTWVQHPRGENVRPQDRPGRLVNDPKPADLGLVGDRDSLRGVDLPGLMRPLGSHVGGGRPGPTARRSRGDVGVPGPTSDRLGAGPGDQRPLLGEHHADQFGPPTRVVATQGEGRLADLIGIDMIKCRRSAIAGEEAGIPMFASPFQEMAHGARREIEGLGQRGGGFPSPGSLPDFLTDRNGDRLGHRGRLRVSAVKIKDAHPFQHVTRPLAKPHVRNNPAKPTER